MSRFIFEGHLTYYSHIIWMHECKGLGFRVSKNKGCVTHIVALPFTLKKYLFLKKAKEELWKLKLFYNAEKYNLQKNPSKIKLKILQDIIRVTLKHWRRRRRRRRLRIPLVAVKGKVSRTLALVAKNLRGNGFDRGSRSFGAIVCWAPNRAAGEAESGARERALYY